MIGNGFGNAGTIVNQIFIIASISIFAFILFGSWESATIWRDDELCNLDSVPSGCPTESVREMSNETRSRLHDMWLYFYGDSTMRQIAQEFTNKFMVQNFTLKADKDLMRQCPEQVGRNPYKPPEYDSAQCYLNEKTCNNDHSWGNYSVKVSKDWKHFIYEDYDEWLFLKVFPEIEKTQGRLPDVLIVSTGLHSCYHFEEPIWLPKHFRQVDDFLEVIISAKSRPKQVIFLDASVHINVKEKNPIESICGVKVNEYIQWKIQELLLADEGLRSWLSFISRDKVTRTAPKDIWDDKWSRVHLDDIVQSVYLMYILEDILGPT